MNDLKFVRAFPGQRGFASDFNSDGAEKIWISLFISWLAPRSIENRIWKQDGVTVP